MPPPVQLVIFDLDGLLLNVESIVTQAASTVLAGLDPPRALTADALAAARGRRPLDAWAATAAALGLDPAAAPALLTASEALLRDRWHTCAPMPGALRLVAHLRSAAPGVRTALATSTPRATFEAKTGAGSAAAALGAHAWDAVVCGDDPAVARGKPAPDAFLAAAAAAAPGGVPPAACLVLEDAPAGVAAAVAAGMRCVLVPSLTDAGDAYPPALGPDAPAGVTQTLPSLFSFDPALHGLPPFTDALPVGPDAGRVTSAIPFWPGPDAFRLRGRVVRGFGRGSAQLGIPTANLAPTSLTCLADAVTGIYACWAMLGDGCEAGAGVAWPAVASIGFNPQFQAETGGAPPQKTAEPWILAPPGALPDQFYGADLRLLVVAFLRPEAKFSGLDALVAQIHADAAAARVVLASEALAGAARDPFFD
jgi:riboflavin kinase / FMN hydrolase